MNKTKIKAFVFDAYGTLFDVHSVVSECANLFPGQGEAFSRLWRTKQLEYTWLRSLMGKYVSFQQVTEEALKFTCRSFNIPCDPEIRHRLMNAYLHLDTYPDVTPALKALSGIPLAILSNGSPGMLDAVVANADLASTFRHVISVDEVKIFKPDPRVYDLAPRKLGVDKSEIGFVSSNCWDAVGAKAFGFSTFWINRAGAAMDEMGIAPNAVLGKLTELKDLVTG
ncbi:MAG: haloacid dehalogenase type II [Betaproteobacteria bacterium]|nr:haloacid dehalogenase type II [Betaproteobacteria bacterium]